MLHTSLLNIYICTRCTYIDVCNSDSTPQCYCYSTATTTTIYSVAAATSALLALLYLNAAVRVRYGRKKNKKVPPP